MFRSCAPWSSRPAVQHAEGRDVDGEAERGDDQHGRAGDLDGVEQAPDRLDGDPGGDREEREPVDEGGEHGEAVEAVGAPPVGRAPRDARREPGQRQRGEVRQHVPGVGEQRQRARDDAADRLGDHEAAGQQRDDAEPPLLAGTRMVVRVMGVRVAMAWGMGSLRPLRGKRPAMALTVRCP